MINQTSAVNMDAKSGYLMEIRVSDAQATEFQSSEPSV